MADPQTVPIPQGATIGEAAPAASAPQTVPIPAGATIGESSQTFSPDYSGFKGAVGKFADVSGDVATGVVKGMGDTVAGIGSVLNKIPGIGETLSPKAGVSALDTMSKATDTSQEVGKGIESAIEFAAGDEALSGIAKMGKIAQLSPELLALVEKYPKTLKMLQGAGKAATVGAAQGAVKGAPEGKVGQEAVGGAIGGFVGGTAAELGAEMVGALAKRVGIGTTAAEDAARGFKPSKRNVEFADRFEKAAPVIDAQPEFKEAVKNDDLPGAVEAIDMARENWWKQQVQPIIDKHTTEPLGGINIRDSIEKNITEQIKKYNPEQAAAITKFANEFMPGQKFALQIGDAEKDLEYFNAKLASTGYWSKLPAERAALLKTNPEVIAYKGAADAIRDELYGRLGVLEPTVDMADLKQTYGALRNVGDELRGQINVQGRQAPTSLKESLGILTGIATGGWKGIAAAALPIIDRQANTATRLAGRAVQKAARPGEEGAIVKGAKAVGGAVKEAVPNIAAQAGEQVGRIMFQSSDGRTHSVPADQIDAARQVDPNLQIIQP